MRQIVVTYQYETGGAGTNVYGGRLQYHLAGGAAQPSLLGVTFVRQNQGLQAFNLYGADTALLAGRAGHADRRIRALGQRSMGRARPRRRLRLPRSSADVSLAPGRSGHRPTCTRRTRASPTTPRPASRRARPATAARSARPCRRRRACGSQADHEDNKGVAPQPADNPVGILDPGTAPAAGTPVDNSLQTVFRGSPAAGAPGRGRRSG